MKSFLKKNWFKLSTLFILLIILLLISQQTLLGNDGVSELKSEENRTITAQGFEERSLTKIINSLYPDIIFDYLGVYEQKIFQDFGEPASKFEPIGFVDGSLSSEKHIYLSYPLKGGSIGFYIDKETRHASYVEIYVLDENVQVKIPGLVDKGIGHTDIILGVSTYGDIFNLMSGVVNELQNVISYQGGSAGNSYTNLDFYFGKYGNYHEFTFGVPGLYNEKVNEDYRVLRETKPTRLLIK